MIVILRFDLPEKTVLRLQKVGLCGEDLAGAINDNAVSQDFLHGAWHFNDRSGTRVEKALTALWKKEIVDVTRITHHA